MPHSVMPDRAPRAPTHDGAALHVFDMDGTLLPGTSASIEIARFVGGKAWVHALEDDFRTSSCVTSRPTASTSRSAPALRCSSVHYRGGDYEAYCRGLFALERGRSRVTRSR